MHYVCGSMSTFLGANPVMTSAVAQNMQIAMATIGNLTVIGEINANIAVGNLKNLSLQDLTTANLSVINNLSVTTDSFFGGNAILTGQLRVLGTSVASLFSGNGSGLTGIVDAALPGVISSDILGNITGAIANVGTGHFGNVSVAGNVVATYVIGNGSGLTGIVDAALPGVISSDILGNITGASANVETCTFGNVSVSGQVTASGNVSAVFFLGNLIGNSVTSSVLRVSNTFYLTIPGSNPRIVFDTNDFIEYHRTRNTCDLHILGNKVAAFDKNGNLNVSGNVEGQYFIGNVSGSVANVGTGTFGNVTVSGQVTAIGNVVAEYVIGNGSGLSSVTASSLVANIGKITGHYCVAMNGDDATADGSENKPFLTIQAAHDRALAELPPVDGGITNQAQIFIYPGAYSGTTNITRFNTVLRGTGSLYGRGQMTAIGGINVNCSTSTNLYNNTVSIENLFINNSITNTGTGSYILNIDSCYVYGGPVSSGVLTMTNPNSLLFVNASYFNGASSNTTYINANTGIINITDTYIQTPGIQSGHLINVGGNCGLTLERCYINATNSNNAALFVSGSQTPPVNPFKVTLTNSLVINTLGPGIDFGTSGAVGFFVRNTFQVASGRNVFAGNGIAYQNSQLCTPSFSNTKAATFTLLPIASF